MECNSCGIKKPKNDARDFTKVVVENINPEEIVMFRKVVVPASMGDDTTNPPKAGKYHNVILYYEANDHIYIYSSDGIPTLITANVEKLRAALAKEIDDREAADEVLQQEIDEIKNNPDVVDIVDTYADLQAYDTSKLGDKDIIRVLQDETHDGASTYYRWDKPHSTWNYIGEAGDYYTKDQVDTLLGAKQNTLVAGTNIQIAADGVTISAKIIKTFYIDGLSDGTKTLYHDSSKAQAVTVQEFIEAIDDIDVIVNIYDIDGDEQQVVIWGENNSAVVYSTYGDYFYKITAASSDQSSTSFTISHTEMQPKLTAGTNVQIDQLTNTISATDTTYTHFTGATSLADGVQGLVPGPLAGDQDKVLKGDGTWGDVQPGMTTYFLADSLDNYASSGNTFSIYKESSLTTAVTSLEFNEIVTSGPVQLVYSAGSAGTNYYRIGFARDESDGYQMYDEMVYDVINLISGTIYEIEDKKNNSFDILWKRELQSKLTAGTNIQIDTSTNTISATDTTYSTGTSSTAGITKLYDQNGQNTDGAVTQKHFTDVVGDVEAALQILNSGAGVP